ncbi:lytic transglycosylase domain-containing protein [Dyadobacter sp. CY261]|uniref:lytic transglycosylase domain-containing protein n=1 Tax=Dyadobacter sp. CY261 TaxID=2907203 RepID=UPI001F462551|nr:lytic transglycosylase domain-containing protein [Dyadobacter sp. CY261]MCF0073535.1 lytic transglycosylase domain-containing protein [Dyadobacter sp. CY261]
MIRLIFMAFSIAIFGKSPVSEVEVEKKELKEITIINSDLLAIDFCGEAIPLSELRIAERYQNMIRNYDNPTFRKLMTTTKKRMRIIEPILKKYGVPADFKYIPLIESAMKDEVTSRRGAGGYWQLMPSTAKSLGLVIDETRDDRKHLVKSTHAAGKYLRDLYKQLGSWTLVAAAYNAGPTHIQNRMDSQNKDDYFKLRLNSETARYLYKILAVKEWFSNPERSREWGSGDVVERLAAFKTEQKKAAELAKAETTSETGS